MTYTGEFRRSAAHDHASVAGTSFQACPTSAGSAGANPTIATSRAEVSTVRVATPRSSVERVSAPATSRRDMLAYETRETVVKRVLGIWSTRNARFQTPSAATPAIAATAMLSPWSRATARAAI